MLDEANNLHPNIKLVHQIGTTVSFLDLLIENKNGTLVTSVFHKQAVEPYIVPFKSDHARPIFQNVVEGALKRALRYSSTISAFNEEQRSIKLMLLYNRYLCSIPFIFLILSSFKFSYPPRYIYSQFIKFFAFHFPTSNHLLPTITNQSHMKRLHDFYLNRPTVPQYQLASRIATAHLTNPTEELDNSSVQIQLNKQTKFNNNIITHFTYEDRLRNNKKDIHKLILLLFFRCN
jgi:hypothetical protein